MNQLITQAIVLSRTDYGEADRIVTLLTPDKGKLRLIAKGVRKLKSKLASGIELFSISDITYISGRGEVGTLISARLNKHYGNIAKDIDRVQLGYELIKVLNKVTADQTEAEYFDLLEVALASLNESTVPIDLIRYWFISQLLKKSGQAPNLKTDKKGKNLDKDTLYNFDFDRMNFAQHDSGRYNANDIKILRLIFSNHHPVSINKVQDVSVSLAKVSKLVDYMQESYLHM